jgi:hypothetical protein
MEGQVSKEDVGDCPEFIPISALISVDDHNCNKVRFCADSAEKLQSFRNVMTRE